MSSRNRTKIIYKYEYRYEYSAIEARVQSDKSCLVWGWVTRPTPLRIITASFYLTFCLPSSHRSSESITIFISLKISRRDSPRFLFRRNSVVLREAIRQIVVPLSQVG